MLTTDEMHRHVQKLSRENIKLKDFCNADKINLFSDSGIVNNAETEFNKIVVSLDINDFDIYLINKRYPNAAILAHHPLEMLDAGWAREIIKKDNADLAAISSADHFNVSFKAELLRVNLYCAHTLADFVAATYLEQIAFQRLGKKELSVEEIIEKVLLKMDEYAYYSKYGLIPIKEKFSNEKITEENFFVQLGTYPPENYEKCLEYLDGLQKHGIKFIVDSDVEAPRLKAMQEKKISYLMGSHNAMDCIALNLVANSIKEKYGCEIIPWNNFCYSEKTCLV